MANNDGPSNEWSTYFVKAKLSEEKTAQEGEPWPILSGRDVKSLKERVAPNFEAQVYLWPTPLLVSSQGVDDILTVRRSGKILRVYPPFPVDEKGETSGTFASVGIPEGTTKVVRRVPIPSSAVRGLRTEHKVPGTFWCRAFRIDVETGADALPTLRQLLDHIAQNTHQWWIRSSNNPMLGPLRLGCQVTKDFEIVEELRYRGAGLVDSAWYGANQVQSNLGFGGILDRQRWLQAGAFVQEGRLADQGLLAFYDGMSHYMADENQKAILSLCIAVEILLAKHSIGVLRQEPSKLGRAVRNTSLLDEDTRMVITGLVSNRNRVAHGREPILGFGKETLPKYVGAVSYLVNSYFAAMPTGEWPRVMNLRLDEPGAKFSA